MSGTQAGRGNGLNMKTTEGGAAAAPAVSPGPRQPGGLMRQGVHAPIPWT